MKTNKLLLVFLLSALFFATSVLAEETIKIGFIGQMTGAAGVFGQRCSEGFNMFWDEYNTKGGLKGKKIQIIVDDDEGQPAKSINAANKQIEKDEIVAGYATTNSNTSLADVPIFKKYSIAHVTQAFSPQVTKAGSPYVFRVAPVADVFAHTCYEWASKNAQLKTVAIISDKDSYGQTIGDAWEKIAPEYGIKVVTREMINLSDKDFTGQLLKIKELNPQMVVFTINWEMTMGLVAKNMRKLGMTQPILTGAMEVAKYVEYGGDATDGTIIGLPFSGFEEPKDRADFAKRFKEKYGKDPVIHNVWGYDAANILALGLESGYPTVTRESVYQGVKAISGVRMLQGVYDFKKSQDGISKSEMVRLVKGKIVRFE